MPDARVRRSPELISKGFFRGVPLTIFESVKDGTASCLRSGILWKTAEKGAIGANLVMTILKVYLIIAFEDQYLTKYWALLL